MPATYPSHAAAVLPLKLWRPGWFDGVALVVGSMAPDLGYPLAGLVALPDTHSAAALLWWNLPVTLVLSALLRLAAPEVAGHLPERWFALPDYGVLRQVRHRWYVTVCSALVGAVSHEVWDGFTHNPDIGGWAARRLPDLRYDAVPGWPWWYVLQYLSSGVGAVVAVGCLRYIGRHRLIRRWHGPAPVLARAPRRFWLAAGAGPVGYLLTWPVLPYPYALHVQAVRVLWAVAAGLALAGVVTRERTRAGRMGT